MTISNLRLVAAGDRRALERALGALFAADPEPWTVTIRPSRIETRWTIEVLAPGRLWALSAGPAEQSPESIAALVREAVGTGRPDQVHE